MTLQLLARACACLSTEICPSLAIYINMIKSYWETDVNHIRNKTASVQSNKEGDRNPLITVIGIRRSHGHDEALKWGGEH